MESIENLETLEDELGIEGLDSSDVETMEVDTANDALGVEKSDVLDIPSTNVADGERGSGLSRTTSGELELVGSWALG